MKTKPNRLFAAWVAFAGGPDAAAKALDVSTHTIRSLRGGRRRMPPDVAEKIHQLTGGKFDKAELVWPASVVLP